MPIAGEQEHEVALVVASPDPPAVFAHLRRLRALGPHGLETRSTQRLHDRYFDTPSHDLWHQRLALRERSVNGECLLALKGEIGPRQRLEIELRKDEAARRRIEDELRARGIRISWTGLCVIQEGDTTRERRALCSGGRTIAEVALDAVTFRLGGREIAFHEVEVELEDRGVALDSLVVELQRAAPELREWPYNKLATGAAIAAALDRGEFTLDPAGTLPVEALDELAGRLASGGG